MTMHRDLTALLAARDAADKAQTEAARLKLAFDELAAEIAERLHDEHGENGGVFHVAERPDVAFYLRSIHTPAHTSAPIIIKQSFTYGAK